MSAPKLKEALDKKALELLKAEAPIENQVDIFKATSTYYLGTMKAKEKPPEDNGASFSSILAKVQNSTVKAGSA